MRWGLVVIEKLGKGVTMKRRNGKTGKRRSGETGKGRNGEAVMLGMDEVGNGELEEW